MAYSGSVFLCLHLDTYLLLFVLQPTMPLLNRKPFYAFLFAAILLLGRVGLRGLDTTGLWGDQAFTLNTAMRGSTAGLCSGG